MGNLGFLTVDPGTIIMTLCNTLILFLLLKKFLYKPVKDILEKRKEYIKTAYKDADNARTEADKLKTEYTEKLENAKEESAEILRNATKKAQTRSDEIVFAAKDEAQGIMNRANEEIEREKKRAVNQIKNEISDIAVAMASKVVEKEITPADNERLIEEFIGNVGEDL